MEHAVVGMSGACGSREVLRAWERGGMYTKVQSEREHVVDLDLVVDRVSMDFVKHIANIWSDQSDSVWTPVVLSYKSGNASLGFVTAGEHFYPHVFYQFIEVCVPCSLLTQRNRRSR